MTARHLTDAAEDRQRRGRRVLSLARGNADLPPDPAAPPVDLQPLGVVVLGEELRPGIAATVTFFQREGVQIKVRSGDSPQTVAAIAQDVGIPAMTGVYDATALPEDPQALRDLAMKATVIGRISPEGKQRIVQALRDQGRYVAMVGDGVNDVPALPSSRLAIAQGTGTQMARSVADLVLVSGNFDSLPGLVAEGRQALRNLQRVTKLYVTKSVFAAFLILTIGTRASATPAPSPSRSSLPAACISCWPSRRRDPGSARAWWPPCAPCSPVSM